MIYPLLTGEEATLIHFLLERIEPCKTNGRGSYEMYDSIRTKLDAQVDASAQIGTSLSDVKPIHSAEVAGLPSTDVDSVEEQVHD